MQVIQESDGPMTLLTAFGPQTNLQAKGNVYSGKHGDVKWTIQVAGGKANALDSDGHVAVSVQHDKTGAVEIMRYGGKSLSFNNTRVESAADDVFAVIQGGKVSRTVTTLP